MNWLQKTIKDVKSLTTLEKRRLIVATILSAVFAIGIPVIIACGFILTMMVVDNI